MIRFLLKRLFTMFLTALCLTFIVFYLTNLPPNLEKVAKSEIGSASRMPRWTAGCKRTAMSNPF